MNPSPAFAENSLSVRPLYLPARNRFGIGMQNFGGQATAGRLALPLGKGMEQRTTFPFYKGEGRVRVLIASSILPNALSALQNNSSFSILTNVIPKFSK